MILQEASINPAPPVKVGSWTKVQHILYRLDVFSYIRWSFQFSPSVFPPFPAKLLHGLLAPPSSGASYGSKTCATSRCWGNHGVLGQLERWRRKPYGERKDIRSLGIWNFKIDSKHPPIPNPRRHWGILNVEGWFISFCFRENSHQTMLRSSLVN